ncbi:MAG: exodeoxyribonuclease III [Lysobacteraceae bacterium]
MRLRLVSWNIENLAPWLADDGARLAQWHARRGAPDVLCLQEVRIRPGDAELVDRMRRALPGYVCHAALNRDPRNGGFRGGRAYGVATWVREDLAPIALAFDWDREGRACISHLPAANVAIGNVYAVNGTVRPHYDHDLDAVHGDRHAFKQAFIARLGGELATLQAHGLRLLLAGDWNVSRTRLDTTPRLRTEEPHATARRRFDEEFVAGLGLVDVFRAHHPDARAYTWFNRRARGGRLDAARVDFVLAGRALADRVTATGIDAAEEARPGSDHAPAWVELDIEPA